MAGGTETLPGPGDVLTLPAPTQPGLPLTLVDVHADLHHGGLLVALVTVAGEAPLDIPALSVPTDARGDAALVNVHTAGSQQVMKAVN